MKAAIFDLDGTLADTLESLATATNKVLNKLGFKSLPLENYKYYAGDGAKMLVKRALTDAGDTELSHFEEAYKEYQDFFAKDCTYKVKVFEGMRETITNMKEIGIKVGVLTNKPHDRALQVISYLFGDDFFDIVLGEQPGIPKKPSCEGALMIAEQFGVQPKECLYIVDTNVDMKTGKGAGMFTVGVLWGFRTEEELRENHADAIVNEPEDLLELL